MPSWLGFPPRANESHAVCICSDNNSTSGPDPVSICTAGMCTAPKTKGRSSAWQEPSTPPRAGEAHSKR